MRSCILWSWCELWGQMMAWLQNASIGFNATPIYIYHFKFLFFSFLHDFILFYFLFWIVVSSNATQFLSSLTKRSNKIKIALAIYQPHSWNFSVPIKHKGKRKHSIIYPIYGDCVPISNIFFSCCTSIPNIFLWFVLIQGYEFQLVELTINILIPSNDQKLWLD